MAEGKITVSNFSEQPMNVQIVGDNGGLVASGSLAPAQSSGFLVSGYQQYRVNFYTGNNRAVTASNLGPESNVQIEITGG